MKLKVLKRLKRLIKESEELWELSKIKYQDRFDFFLDYNASLDFLYLLYGGKSYSEIYNSFSTTTINNKNQPVAWYKGTFSSNKDGSILGPEKSSSEDSRFAGFIPDCINEVILSDKLSSMRKHKLLTRMFKDLKMLEKKYANT